MAFTRLQAAGANNGFDDRDPISATFSGAVTAGSLLVCFWEGHSPLGASSCADNINGAWTATTFYTDIPSSTKSYTWFYKLATASASAGSLTVTVTPNAAAASGTELMQIAEYSAAAGLDTAVSAHGTHASGTTATLTSGTPTQTGDLVLMGFAGLTNTDKTFTANSPLTAIVLDGSSHTAGQANGSACIAFAELLNAGTGTVAGSMGIGINSSGAKFIIGFSPPTGSVVTKTQTATARIANTRTATQSATSRIANTRTKTQSATSRIAVNLTKTQGAVARVANTRTKAQSATAAIGGSLSKTQAAIASIANTRSKTQSATSRIAFSNVKTQSARARISCNFQKTQTATARVVQTVFLFSPPTTEGHARGTDRFWRSFRPQMVGVTVLKENNVYRETSTPTSKEVAAADVTYMGGHVYEVTAEEASDLVAAGYTTTSGVNG